MTTLEVLTPSYRPDYELCVDLQRSVRVHGGEGVSHRIVVPRRDLQMFTAITDERTRIDPAISFLPRSLVPMPRNLHVQLTRPWWPVRGWIAQQIVKLEATARSTADVVVVADSDLVFVRPFDADTFSGPTGVQFYALPGAVHAGMPRHIEWHRVAHRLLGLPPPTGLPLSDYVCWPCAWDPSVVRALLARISSTHGRPWQRLVASQRHFSEMILYGVYVTEVLGSTAPLTTVADMHCPRHMDESALGASALRDLVDVRSPEDIAIMISAKSGTDVTARRAALSPVLDPQTAVDKFGHPQIG
jgi:hypothetical protein